MPFFDHFDILAPLYDRLISPPDERRIIRITRLPIEGILLDVGGGTGRISQHMVGLARKVIVLDSSINMLDQTKVKNGLHPIASAAEALPFPDQTFERIVMVDALHHLADQPASLRELWRVLGSDGVLVIEEPDIRHFGVKLVALAEKLTLFRSHFLSAERIARCLAPFGAFTQIIREKPNVWVVAQKPK